MENFNGIYILLIIVVIALTARNIIQIAKIKHVSSFSKVYSKILKREPDAYEEIKKYVEEEKDDSIKNKARLLLIYEMMMNNEDPMNVVEDTNLGSLFKAKGAFNSKAVSNNSDAFVWLALVFAKARALSMFDVIENLTNKVTEYNEQLDNRVEYRLFKGLCSSLAERNDDDSAFLQKLLNGDYADMTYDQKLIGLYKRIASAYLIYMGDTVDEYFENDLHSFAQTSVGHCLMTDLEIIDKYPPLKEVENTVPTSEEVKEETKEQDK